MCTSHVPQNLFGFVQVYQQTVNDTVNKWQQRHYNSYNMATKDKEIICVQDVRT